MKIAIKLLLLASISSGIVAIQPCFTDKQLHEISADDFLTCLKSANEARVQNNIDPIVYNITTCGKLFIEGISTENSNTQPCNQNCTSSVNEAHVTAGVIETLQQTAGAIPSIEGLSHLSEDFKKDLDQSEENPYSDRQD